MCAIHRGELRCWAGNSHGQLGQPLSWPGYSQFEDEPWTLPAVQVGSNPLQVVLGPFFTCVISNNGSVFCWGDNTSCQCGQPGGRTVETCPTTFPPYNSASGPLDLGPGRTAVSLTTSYHHVCVLRDDATLKCFGNIMGRFYYQCETDKISVEPSFPRAVIDVCAGWIGHTCALLDDGSVFCWGINASNVLGSPSAPGGTTPSQVDLGWNVQGTALACGGYHACVLTSTAQIKCWGDNSRGQLGNSIGPDTGSSMGDNLPFVDLGQGVTVTAITAGYYHTCAVLGGAGNDRVKCWGSNDFGQLGVGDTISRGGESDAAQSMGDNLPYASLSLDAATDRVRQVWAGWDKSCAVMMNDDWSMECWGDNGYGELGLALPYTGNLFKTTPVGYTRL
jgi:alpha-tubulin suppressor-like RCC1 family protein